MYLVFLILFFFPGEFIWLLYMHTIDLKVPVIIGLFIKLYSVWTWCCFFRIIPWAIMWLQYAILFDILVIQSQYEGSLNRLDAYCGYKTAFFASAPYILEQRIQFWLKSLKIRHLCFIYCMNYEPSSLSSLFYFEDYIWNRVTFTRSLLVGMFVWIDPQNQWPARLLNWHWGLAFIHT